MTALASALASLATILGVWSAASLLSVPVLVLCVRTQARANARLTRRLRRGAWTDSSRR